MLLYKYDKNHMKESHKKKYTYNFAITVINYQNLNECL